MPMNGPIRDQTTATLIALLTQSGMTAYQLVPIIRELRRRADFHPTDRQMLRMNSIDPPPCWCGRPGLYIVGTLTFCRQCRKDAMLQHRLRQQELYTARTEAEYDRDFRDRERERKVRDGAARLHRGRHRR